MEIKKTIIKVYKVLDVTKKPFLKYGLYRESRERHKFSVEKSCFNCGKKFQDEDETYLAITTKGNKILCEKCAKIALDDLNK